MKDPMKYPRMRLAGGLLATTAEMVRIAERNFQDASAAVSRLEGRLADARNTAAAREDLLEALRLREAALLDAGQFAQGFADTMSGDEATGAKAVATSLLVLASRAALGRFSAEAAPTEAASEGERT